MTEADDVNEQRDDSRTPGWLPLGIALGAGPSAWFLHLVVSYGFGAFLCPDRRWLHVLTASFSMVALVGMASAWYVWARTGRADRPADRPMDRSGNRPSERSRFLAVSGLLMDGLFALLILSQGSVNLFFDPCGGVP